MSLKSVSASEDVIGDLPSPMYFADGIGETNDEGVEKKLCQKPGQNNPFYHREKNVSKAGRDAFSGLTKTERGLDRYEAGVEVSSRW